MFYSILILFLFYLCSIASLSFLQLWTEYTVIQNIFAYLFVQLANSGLSYSHCFDKELLHTVTQVYELFRLSACLKKKNDVGVSIIVS